MIIRILVTFLLLFVFMRTMSYGKWTWDKKNKLGAIMIYALAFAAVILPIYSIYFRE